MASTQNNLNLQTNTLPAPNLVFVLMWAFLTGIGGMLTGIAENTVFQFGSTLLLTGIFVGGAQALVIRINRLNIHAIQWAINVLVGWLIGTNFTFLIGDTLDPLVATLTQTGWMWGVFWLNLVQGVVIGAVIGFMQMWLLRGTTRFWGWWILVSMVALAAQGAVGSATCYVGCAAVGIWGAALAYGVGWLAAGLIGGGFLAWMLTQD